MNFEDIKFKAYDKTCKKMFTVTDIDFKQNDIGLEDDKNFVILQLHLGL